MSEQRYSYTYHRVLIDSARVLDSQFDDAVIYVTGAQLELLRNVTQYLNRLSTYVSDYQPGYYLTPTIENYDDILAIVADLEEVLMGNPNTIWGYLDPYRMLSISSTMPAGESNLWGDNVPAGEVWRLSNVVLRTDSATCTKILVRVRIDGLYLYLREQLNPTVDRLYPFTLDAVMKEGDHVYCTFYGMTLNDTAEFSLSGYKMKVPE